MGQPISAGDCSVTQEMPHGQPMKIDCQAQRGMNVWPTMRSMAPSIFGRLQIVPRRCLSKALKSVFGHGRKLEGWGNYLFFFPPPLSQRLRTVTYERIPTQIGGDDQDQGGRDHAILDRAKASSRLASGVLDESRPFCMNFFIPGSGFCQGVRKS